MDDHLPWSFHKLLVVKASVFLYNRDFP